MINAANLALGSVYKQKTAFIDYFGLKTENQRLAWENAQLRNQLSRYTKTDSLPDPQTADYIVARVVNNSFTKRDNYITIDKGSKQGIRADMALINDQGIVGYVLDCSDNYSVAISVLNTTDFRTSGKIKGSDFTGSIMWDGLDYRKVYFDEIPKYADMNLGDTVVTTDYSNIFPSERPIGTIINFELINGTFFKAQVKLFTDFSRLKYVYAVELKSQAERATLEEGVLE